MSSYDPKLYDKDEVTLIDTIYDAIECKVREERNGIFELTLDYPADGPLLYEFKKERVILSKANPKLLDQKFVIHKVYKYMKKKIKVVARHISFDLLYDACNSVHLEHASCEYALNTLFRQSRFSQDFRGFSDIINAQDYHMENTNIIEAIAGKEGSIIDTYGTGPEIYRDNKNFHVLERRGHDNSVSIEYGVNLTGFECSEDTTDLVTCIVPYAEYRNDEGDQITVKGDFVESPRSGEYKHLYIKHKDYTSKIERKEDITIEKLNELARDDFKTSDIDIPKFRYEIKFIPLSQCVGYEDFEDKIDLCDIVTVKNRVYNIEDKAKVVAVVFDVKRDRYESMELGEPRTTLGSILSGSNGKDGADGKDGKDGAQGPAGEDGKVENMPDTLPETPVLTSKVYGMGTIELSWTFENKLYYNYELYASRIKDFNPTTFDLIHSGQSSSFPFKGKAGETWYFRVCAINSHNRRTPFSSQVEVTLKKEEDLANYFSDIAIGQAVARSITADYMEAGMFKGNWIDARNLSVTDGNGKRTLDIDSWGNITLMPSVFKMLIDGREEDVATRSELIATSNELRYTISESGGDNEVADSSFLAHGYKWFEHNAPRINYEVDYLNAHYGRMISITSDNDAQRGLFQRFSTIPNQKYTVSFYAEAFEIKPLETNIGIEGIHVITLKHEPGFKRWSFEFTATKREHTFIAYILQAGTFFLGRVMVNQGGLQEYSPRRNEIYSVTAKFDRDGLHVESSESNTTATLDSGGLSVKNKDDNIEILSARNGDVIARGGHFKVTHPQNGDIVLWGRDVVINNGRALVGTGNVSEIGTNKLFINYENDFFRGVHIGGDVSMDTIPKVAGYGVMLDKGFNWSETGYQILSSGLILQWGVFGGFGDQSTQIWFPVAFPHACHYFGTEYDGDPDCVWRHWVFNVNNSGGMIRTLFHEGAGRDRSRLIKWFAVGY